MNYYVKALYAGAMAFLGGLQAALLAVPDTGFGDVQAVAWIGIAIFTLGAIGGVLRLQSAPASVATSIKPE